MNAAAIACAGERAALAVAPTNRNACPTPQSPQRLAGASLLVFANKQDVEGALSADEIRKTLGLDEIAKRHWRIEACSAYTGEGLLSPEPNPHPVFLRSLRVAQATPRGLARVQAQGWCRGSTGSCRTLPRASTCMTRDRELQQGSRARPATWPVDAVNLEMDLKRSVSH